MSREYRSKSPEEAEHLREMVDIFEEYYNVNFGIEYMIIEGDSQRPNLVSLFPADGAKVENIELRPLKEGYEGDIPRITAVNLKEGVAYLDIGGDPETQKRYIVHLESKR